MSDNITKGFQQEEHGSILWLTGWSMPPSVFDALCALLPEFHHHYADYGCVDSPEEMMALAEKTALSLASSSPSPLLVAGWSLGGLLALKLAAKGLADGLILLGATAKFTRPREQMNVGWADGHVRQMLKGLMRDRHEVETSFRALLFSKKEKESGISVKLPPIGYWTTSSLCAGLELLRAEECLSLLPEIDCPVLLLHGMDDEICPIAAAEELYQGLPRAELITISDCGHVPFIGREQHIVEALRRWRT
ncbi:alpha/beta hydrolase [Paenibacillus spongiae]|uniref:Alpha/beta hydrolase n=1 Tax=Paenibacillus spongiae TaxID=2909671 RepID=A0ABY5SGZ8_9BACL|nr:alpha/beta hydrolase [Paenibacillus spongiae]UVI33276.1 alpha/beta hydrolase [Paenibacillus spongiae]